MGQLTNCPCKFLQEQENCPNLSAAGKRLQKFGQQKCTVQVIRSLIECTRPIQSVRIFCKYLYFFISSEYGCSNLFENEFNLQFLINNEIDILNSKNQFQHKLLFDKTFCFSASASIPAQLGSLTPDMTTVKTCLNDPTASGCTGTYSGSSSIPGIVSTVPTLSTDVTTLKGCMTDPTDSSCTVIYSTTSSMPVITATMAALPALSADVMTLKGCMTNPSDTSCTGTYSLATNLNKLVDSMSKCMTNPTASDCTSIYTNPTTLPKVAHILSFDLIHRSISRSSCQFTDNSFRFWRQSVMYQPAPPSQQMSQRSKDV